MGCKLSEVRLRTYYIFELCFRGCKLSELWLRPIIFLSSCLGAVNFLNSGVTSNIFDLQGCKLSEL